MLSKLSLLIAQASAATIANGSTKYGITIKTTESDRSYDYQQQVELTLKDGEISGKVCTDEEETRWCPDDYWTPWYSCSEITSGSYSPDGTALANPDPATYQGDYGDSNFYFTVENTNLYVGKLTESGLTGGQYKNDGYESTFSLKLSRCRMDKQQNLVSDAAASSITTAVAGSSSSAAVIGSSAVVDGYIVSVADTAGTVAIGGRCNSTTAGTGCAAGGRCGKTVPVGGLASAFGSAAATQAETCVAEDTCGVETSIMGFGTKVECGATTLGAATLAAITISAYL